MHHHHVLSLSLSLAQGYTDLHAFLCRSNLRLFILLWIPAPSSSIGLPFILFQPPRGPNEKLKRSKKVYIYIYIYTRNTEIKVARYPTCESISWCSSPIRAFILEDEKIQSIRFSKKISSIENVLIGQSTDEWREKRYFSTFLLILVHRQFDFNIPRVKSQRYSRDLGEIKCVINWRGGGGRRN